jgi:nitrogen fixation protein NifU and related proteins
VSDGADALQALYREAILEHGRKPRHARLPADAARRAERDNPLCGDHVAVGIALDGAIISVIGFECQGCLICTAAASMMCEALAGVSLSQARALCERYLGLVEARAPVWPDDLAGLAAFAAVNRFPARATCATLAWLALRDAIGEPPAVD